MAKIKTQTESKRIVIKKSRPGVHAKTKASAIKTSKNYIKKYRGQGK